MKEEKIEIIIKIKLEQKHNKININVIDNFIDKYINKEGVWALYGIKDKCNWECLNVGKCQDVGKEILYDLGCLYYVPFRNDGEYQYISNFNNYCGFNYGKGQVQEYLYPYIAKEYDKLKFIYIHDKSDLNVEKDYAEKKKAIFWRNGRPRRNDFINE